MTLAWNMRDLEHAGSGSAPTRGWLQIGDAVTPSRADAPVPETRAEFAVL
jgi:hypothetical protein